ncbi:MAG TPA: tyrosine-type recombinase/integrase [Lachnospiraceae bacterium]|nr:tyrosine-type recombinase/integrase [Lachnospiraceae bacterium]
MKNNQLNKTLFFSKTNDFLNIYLPRQAMKSDNTIETYRDGLTVFRKYLIDKKLISIRKFKFEDCTHEFLLEYMAHLKEKGCASATCNNRLAAIRAYLWYVADGEVSMQSIALAASKVPFIKGEKKVNEVINADDFAALLLAPPANTKIGIRDRTIMILLYDSAIRVAELRELTVSSLYLTAEIPYIRIHGKGDKERIVSITDKTVEHLKKYISIFHEDKVGDRPLFYTVIKGNLSAISTGNIERILNKYAEIIRPDHPTLPQKIHPHMFRRTRACGLYQSGVELELVSRILGHSSTQVTRIYASPSIEMLKAAMESNSVDTPEPEEWLEDEAELARFCGIR